MSRELAAAARRFADAQSERLSAGRPGVGMVLGTVASVTTGGAGDGNALVKVTLRGNPVTCAGYVASYTPVSGHRVVCALVDDQLIIIGRVVGQP